MSELTSSPGEAKKTEAGIWGDWGDFHFKKAGLGHYPKIVSHIQESFMRDEPTCQLLGSTTDFADELESVVGTILGDNLSILVEHKGTGELVGLGIIARLTPKTSASLDLLPISSSSGKVVLRLLIILRKMVNLFEAYGVEEVAELCLSSCSPKYRGKGILTEIYRRSLELLKGEGFTLTCSTISSNFARRAVRRLGYMEVCRLDYKEFIDELGQPVFVKEELDGDQHYAAVMVKQL